MIPGSIRTFYQSRRVLLILGAAAPVVLLAGIYFFVSEVLLKPGVPGPDAPADVVAHYIMHAKGLPTLNQPRAEAFLEQLVRRLVQDADFRTRFIQEYRVAAPDDQEAFRGNLFGVIKPIFMRDIDAWHRLEGQAQRDFIDERIVAYNRLRAFWGDVTINKQMLGGGALSPQETLQFVLQRTTEEEREHAIKYGQALAARVTQILADPDLKADFEARLAAPANP